MQGQPSIRCPGAFLGGKGLTLRAPMSVMWTDFCVTRWLTTLAQIVTHRQVTEESCFQSNAGVLRGAPPFSTLMSLLVLRMDFTQTSGALTLVQSQMHGVSHAKPQLSILSLESPTLQRGVKPGCRHSLCRKKRHSVWPDPG